MKYFVFINTALYRVYINTNYQNAQDIPKYSLETQYSKKQIHNIMLSANITHTLSLLHDKHSPGSTADRCTTASSCTGDFAIRQALAPCLFLSSASLLSSSAVSTAPFLLIMKIINTL